MIFSVSSSDVESICFKIDSNLFAVLSVASPSHPPDASAERGDELKLKEINMFPFFLFVYNEVVVVFLIFQLTFVLNSDLTQTVKKKVLPLP